MTSLRQDSFSTWTHPLKRTHSWPPSQWYLDRFTEDPDSPNAATAQPSALSSPERAETSISPNVPPNSPERLSEALEQEITESGSESSSVRAASHKAVAGSTFASSIHLSARHSSLGRSGSSLADRPPTSATEKKASFRQSHIKRWSRDMSRTSKRVARHLFPRRSKDRNSSFDETHQAFEEEEIRPRGRSKSRLRHPSHEMSMEHGISPPLLAIPAPPVLPERRSSVVWSDMPAQGRLLDIPRRDLLDLNGGVQAAAGMPHQVRRRHASGKRKASREPERNLQDIKEELNASQVFRDEWAARIRANPPTSPKSLRARASSDSSVPSSVLSR